MDLIKACHPNNFDEWQKYYLESGKEASILKTKLTFTSLEELKDMIYVIDCEHGKTEDDLVRLAKDFKNQLEKDGIHLDLETCYNYVFIRAVDETYIGYQREQAAFKSLEDFCKTQGLKVKDTSPVIDVKFGVDYEIYKGKYRLCGVQVKGATYKEAVKSGEKTITKANAILKEINAQYTKKRHVPVLYLYMNKDLTVANPDFFDKVKERKSKAIHLSR